MMQLHVAQAPWGLNPSPFCLKVETYCKLANIPVVTVTSSPLRGPRGKLPFLTIDREAIPDSQLIIQYFKRRFGDPLDGNLTSEQMARGHLIRRTCEESLYFVLVYSRWIDPEGWAVIKRAFFGSLPLIARDIVPELIRRSVRRSLKGQGYGRHPPSEIYALGAADLSALSTLIRPPQFALGERATSYDATLYSMLANILNTPVETPLAREARRHSALTDYVKDMESLLNAGKIS